MVMPTPRSPWDKPWPTQTPVPQVPESSTSRRKRSSPVDRRKLLSAQRRQGTSVPDQDAIDQAEQDCQVFSGNNVLSCYPTSNTTIYQNQWATFVWNSRLPQYAQTNTVNIYLFHGDSGEQVFSRLDYPNPTNRAGDITALVNDTWWGDRGQDYKGQNISYLFYWVITPSTQSLESGYFPQSTFTAVQTTYPDAMLSTMTSASSSLSTALSDSNLSSTSRPTGTVQNSNETSSFPHWAIAVISVLGFLALSVTCVLLFLFCRIRRRRYPTHRDSVTSATPIMAETPGAGQLSSPLLGPRGSATGDAPRPTTGGTPSIPGKATGDDGSLAISRSNSAQESGLISGADAAIMADAFRMALRKPEFIGGTTETPEDSPEGEAQEAELLNKELAEEGRDIRSVSTSRSVKVEGPSE